MKNKFLKSLLIIILVVSFIDVFFVMSIIDLLNTRDVCEVNLEAAGELLIVENSINGIIPTGKDYYYIGLGNEGDIYTIHAGKKWLSDNFDENGIAYSDSITIKGLAKRASDYDVEKEIANRANQFANESGYNLALEPGYVVELNYVADAIIKLIAGFFILLVGIIIEVFRKRGDEFPAWTGKAVLILFILAIAFALWAIL